MIFILLILNVLKNYSGFTLTQQNISFGIRVFACNNYVKQYIFPKNARILDTSIDRVKKKIGLNDILYKNVKSFVINECRYI